MKKQLTLYFIILGMGLLTLQATAQQGAVGIGTNKPHPSAVLNIESGNKGLLIPRIELQTETSYKPIPAIPANGLLVYNTSENGTLKEGFYYWTNNKWYLLVNKEDVNTFAGASFHTGNGIPTGQLGKNDDTYLDLNDSKLYQKENGIWQEKALLQGPKGDTGATGTKGDTGAAGPAGTKGDKGDTGAAGPAGTKGDKGDTGAAGPAGTKGDKGDTGAAGPAGTKGDKGDTGAAGPAGTKGDKGDTGAAGPAGTKGDKGDKGDTGAPGPAGTKGDKGDKGDTGAPGPAGTKGDKGDTGAPGPAGTKGDKGDTGAAGPAGTKGDKGDTGKDGILGATAGAGIIINTTTKNIAAKTTEALWNANQLQGATIIKATAANNEQVLTYNQTGNKWQAKPATAFNWGLNGNANTLTTSFIGTTDAKPLVFKTNNTERMKIETNGNLIIAPNPHNDKYFKVSQDASGQSLRMSSGNQWLDFLMTNDAASIGTYDSKPLYLKTYRSNRISILANGKVGINTDSPTAQLHVNGTVKLENTAVLTSPDYIVTMNAQSEVKKTAASNIMSIPKGLISMWSGTLNTIPAGWALCDGTKGTPNLRDRFIVGAGTTYSVGNTGGANQVTLTTAQMPSHSHSIPNAYNRSSDKSYGWSSGTMLIPYNPVTLTTDSKGGNQAHENRPPYYALYYIMKL